ncbi:hypothetical protein MRX96_051104 [Rhipicephalus microplus]
MCPTPGRRRAQRTPETFDLHPERHPGDWPLPLAVPEASQQSWLRQAIDISPATALSLRKRLRYLAVVSLLRTTTWEAEERFLLPPLRSLAASRRPR